MEKVALGTKVNRLGIQRLSCAVGATCRAILLDKEACMKHVAYDESIGRTVEVDQDMVLKLGLRPYPTFYYLVAKLNTDLNGNVVGDQFTVEYIQLSENLNNEFADALREFRGVPASLALTKVKKVGDNGKDFSHIKVTASNLDPLEDNPKLAEKINQLRADGNFIDQCWKMIDATTSITKEKYFELLAAKGNEKQQGQSQLSAQVSSAPKSLPGNDFAETNDFDAEEFKNGF
jgi:hypothetical protein